MAFDPIPTSFAYDDPEKPEGDVSKGAYRISDAIDEARTADPLKSEITVRSQRKADLGRTKQALDQLENTFLSTEGTGLFQLDEKGKPFKNPDGTYVPDLGAKVETLRARSLGQVGFVQGALTPGVSRGDSTSDALAAQQELSQIEPIYEAKRQKWERIQEQRNLWKQAHDQNELELGALSAERLARQGLLVPQQPQQAPMGQPAQAAPTPVQPSEASVPAPVPAQDPTFLGEMGKNATDLVASFGSGSNALMKMAGDLYGLASGDFNNWLSEQGKYGMDYFERMKSPEMLAKQAQRKAAIDAAPDELGKAWAFVKSTVTDPMLFASSVVEQLPNTVGTGGVGAVVRKGAEKILLRKAATEAAKTLAEKQALKLGVGAAVGAGAAMQGADVGGDQYGTLLVEMERMTKPQLEKIPEIAELVKRGASIDEAKLAYALTQARKTGAVAGAISLAAQALPGGSTIEKTLAGGAAGRSVRGRIAGAVVGGVGEAVSESVEEGGGQVASNVFAQGVDPNRKLTQGVGEAVGQAIVTAGPMGAGAGALNSGAAPESDGKGSVVPGNPNNIPPLAQPIPVNPPAAGPAAQTPPPAPADENTVTVDPELQAELDAETQQPTAPKAPVSTQGGPDAQAGLIRQPSAGSTPAPAPTSQPPVSPFKVSSPEVKAAWMEGPPADPTKMEQVRDGFSQPGVKLGYSVFDGAPGKPRALQIDAIDANGESMVSSNIYDLARAGIEVPIPPADLKPGTYTREQIEQALASQRPTTTQTSGDVTQSPQSAQPTEEEIDDATVAAAEREVDEIEADSTEPAKEIAPDALGEVAPKSVLRVTLQDGTVIEGNYNNAQGNGFIRDTKTNEYRVLTGPAMGPKEQDNPVTKVEMLRDGLDVQAEQDGRKFGEPAYKQPKTRDEYENTLFDLALKATTRSENYDQAEARRSFQLQAQFDRLADEIQLSKVKRRYILAQAARRARGEPLQNPNEFAEGPIDSLRYGVPRSSDFDPDAEKRTKNRAPLPPHAYMTKAEVESSLADARMKGSTTKNPKRREKMAQIVQLRKQQLATGKYREAVQAALDASKNEKPKYDKSSTQVTLPEEQAKPFRDFAASIADEDVYTEEGDRTFGRETEPHITALYGIENDDVDAVKTALAGVGPIKVALGEVTAFENADKPYDVLKVDVNSPALRKVNAAIKQGTKNSSDFPDYKPHLTIGYVKKGTAKKYVGDDRFAGETLSFNSLQFRTRDGRSIDIPLTGSTTSAQTTTQAPGSGEGITNGQLPQGSATKPGAGTLPSNGQSQKVPTEAEGQVGGQQPAPGVRPGAGKGPAIPRGSNTPARFAQVATQAAGLKNSDTGAKFLRDFAPRLQKANPKAFADMEVNVLTDAEWKAHPSLSKSNPDSAAAFNIDRNILHLNADKVQGGQKIAEAIVHEAGHFAEFFALGEEFTQQQWESLTDEQRQDAAKSYDWKDERPGTDLKTDRRARAEWVAMQFTRVITGDTAAMDSTLKQKLQDWLEVVREVVQQWLGNKRYTTAELDSKILELMGYVDDRPKPDMTPVPYQEIDYSTGDIFEVEKPVSEIAAEAKQSVKRYEALLECLNR